MDALDGRQYDGRDLKISIDAGRPTRYAEKRINVRFECSDFKKISLYRLSLCLSIALKLPPKELLNLGNF